MSATSQLFPPGSRNAPRTTGASGVRAAYGLPRVRELPLRLEPVAPDTFGGLVRGGGAASRNASFTNHWRGALS